MIFRLLTSIEARLRSASDKAFNQELRKEWSETAIIIINGVSDLLANYLDVLTANKKFFALWQSLLGHFATMLDFHMLDVNSATFSSLSTILSKCEDGSSRNLDKKSIDLAWELWSRGISMPDDGAGVQRGGQPEVPPVVGRGLAGPVPSYPADLDLERVQRMLKLLRDAMLQATPGSHANDIEYVTLLQGQNPRGLQGPPHRHPGCPICLDQPDCRVYILGF